MITNGSNSLSDLLQRVSSIAGEIAIEEDNYKRALHNHSTAEQLEAIKDRLQFLKRKHDLFHQAIKMRRNSSQ